MSRLTRTLTAAAGAAGLSAALVVAPSPAVAAAGPDRIDLVTGSMPEGIAAGPGTTFFAGARSDGAVYAGDVTTGVVELLVAGDGEGPAVGLLYDARSGLLWVAGGNGGDITAYDAETGEVVFRQVVEGAGFLNDLVITDDAVYVTDSFRNRLTVITLDSQAFPDESRQLVLSGDYVQPAGFGANGIRELPSGDLVLVSGGVLYAVDPATGTADIIEVSGRQLAGGDGLVIDGSTLYVVNGYGGDEVAVLRLSADSGSAQAVGVVRAQELDRPTTGAIVDGALYVVNGRFQTLGQNPEAAVYVTKLHVRRS